MVALSGGLDKPGNGEVVVFLYRNAVIVEEAQVALCPGVSRFGGLAIQPDGFTIRKT